MVRGIIIIIITKAPRIRHGLGPGGLFTNVCRRCATTSVVRRPRGSVVATIRLIHDRRRKYSSVRRTSDVERTTCHENLSMEVLLFIALTSRHGTYVNLWSKPTIKVVLWRVIEVREAELHPQYNDNATANSE